MESPNKCPKCGGKNVWTFAGAIRQEEYCRDCNWLCDCGKRYPKTADQQCPSCKTPRPVKSDVHRVGEWIERIRASGGSTTLVGNLGLIGPAGRAAVPLLCELYRKHGKGDFLGCAAYDALRDLDALRDVIPDSSSASGGDWAHPAQNIKPKSVEEFVPLACKSKTSISVQMGDVGRLIGLLNDAIPRERPDLDAAKAFSYVMDGLVVCCPRCGQLNENSVAMLGLAGTDIMSKAIFGGPNVAVLGQGRCPNCGGVAANIIFTPPMGGLAQPIPISPPKTPEEKLRSVTTLLLTIGWIEGVLAALMLIVGILMAFFPNERQANDPNAPHPAIIPAVCAFGVVRAYFIIRGAMRMQTRESYGNAILTASLTAIPVGGCCLLGFPVGIGSLVVLCDLEVKRLFFQDSQEILAVLPAV